jgi:hypothetical protein
VWRLDNYLDRKNSLGGGGPSPLPAQAFQDILHRELGLAQLDDCRNTWAGAISSSWPSHLGVSETSAEGGQIASQSNSRGQIRTSRRAGRLLAGPPLRFKHPHGWKAEDCEPSVLPIQPIPATRVGFGDNRIIIAPRLVAHARSTRSEWCRQD